MEKTSTLETALGRITTSNGKPSIPLDGKVGKSAAKGSSAKVTTHMYAGTKTWNPFKGCKFDCSYCKPSFQTQAKRQKHNCAKCYRYEPHEHPERLAKIPKAATVFVCGNGDIAFCKPAYLKRIVEAIKSHGRQETTFYLQTKRPDCLKSFLKTLPENVVLVTTLETNRDAGYEKVSTKAPKPSERFRQFLDLDYPAKLVTIEPVMDFDVEEFADWIIRINPLYVWLGLNSRDKQVQLPEPSPEKLKRFVTILLAHGIEVRGKHLRGIAIPKGVIRTQD
jgi:uncharacterized Fe-S cluster-containing radical SAM superfamily protein